MGVNFDGQSLTSKGTEVSFYLYQELRSSWNHKWEPHLKYLRLKILVFTRWRYRKYLQVTGSKSELFKPNLQCMQSINHLNWNRTTLQFHLVLIRLFHRHCLYQTNVNHGQLKFEFSQCHFLIGQDRNANENLPEHEMMTFCILL